MKELANMELEPREGFVLSRLNGKWNVQSILKICPMGEQEALAIFKGLIDKDLIDMQ